MLPKAPMLVFSKTGIETKHSTMFVRNLRARKQRSDIGCEMGPI